MSDSPFLPETAFTEGISRRGGYSLGLLFYLTTMFAIFAACFRFIPESAGASSIVILAACIRCSVLGLIIGGIAGFRSSRPLFGMILGLIVGPLAGIPSGVMLVIDVKFFSQLTLTIFTGCWILMTVTLILERMRSRQATS